MTNHRMLAPLLLALALALTAGCSQDSGSGGSTAAPANKERASAQLKPADETLAAIYNRSCRSCHTIAATGAPLTGDTQAWAVRLEKGMPTLVDNVVNGFGGMPPFGLCMDCDAAQFEALVTFMASGK